MGEWFIAIFLWARLWRCVKSLSTNVKYYFHPGIPASNATARPPQACAEFEVAVTEAAWNAQTRLHQRYKHLTGVGRKKSPVAAAALGRELAGFVWAIGRMVKPHPAKPAAAQGKAA